MLIVLYRRSLESVTAESRLIVASWFKTSLTPELYYHDEAYVDEDCSMDTHSIAETVASTASTCLSCGSDGFKIQRYSIIPALPIDSNVQANLLAFTYLQKGFISFGQLGELRELLPNATPRKHVLDHSFLEPRCFTAEVYVFGGDTGSHLSADLSLGGTPSLQHYSHHCAGSTILFRFTFDESMVWYSYGCAHQQILPQYFDSCWLLEWRRCLDGQYV